MILTLSAHFVQAQNIVNLIQNGDFSHSLDGWTPGVSRASTFPGYPQWGVAFNSSAPGKPPHAFLDVPGGGAAYLDSSPFLLSNGGFLRITFWGWNDPVVLGVQLKLEDGSLTALDSFVPPAVALGGHLLTKTYQFPANVTNHTIVVRFSCESNDPSEWNGVICDYQNAIATPSTLPQSSNPIPTPIPTNDGMGLAFALLGLGLAAVPIGVGLAFTSRRGSVQPYWFPDRYYGGYDYGLGWVCTRCGTTIDAYSRYCRRCGSWLVYWPTSWNTQP